MLAINKLLFFSNSDLVIKRTHDGNFESSAWFQEPLVLNTVHKGEKFILAIDNLSFFGSLDKNVKLIGIEILNRVV
ncbi:hypothetical protein LCM10_12105 [Rossellomorea aquimaris]|uniref:hypothetical protein n=1 Tax=Rossellomorea aquimaris TaxID=189382 RepID=UPI001CD7F7AA|nr:hypothetical protein [Rossellomorea aquimaris]MCA1055730.1 hypothetical protein [Rossellomorea aquimaris]